MDFGLVGVDGFVVGSQSSTTTGAAAPPSASSTQVPSAPDTKPRILGSGLGKQARTSGPGQDEWSAFKISRSGDLCPSRAMPLHQGTPLLRSNSILSADTSHQEHMLSFSQPKPEAPPFLSRDGGLLLDRSSQNQAAAFSYYQPAPSLSAAYNKIPGYVNGSLNSSMHGPINGVRGPFTPSQWMELEHQALIYKYLSSNVPVPSNLLLPLKKSVYPCGLSTFSAGSYPPNSWWGSFHLGYPGNTNDPEPGRCRRTDGKKWRCSRDAVADQKYCERHINRGRHRSRKPVEGQSGHSATGTTSSKVVPMTTSVSTPVIVSGGASNSLVIAQQQLKNLEPAAASSSASLLLNRYRSNLSKDVSGRVQHPRGGSTMSSAVNMKKEESSFAIPGQKTLFEESSQPEFGVVSSDSLLNPSERSSYMNSKNYESYLNFGDQQTQDQHPLRQFMDDWPKDQGSRSVISWPEELKSDWTQLSISIPMASSEFSSSSSSPPTHEKFTLSPLRLSREFEPTQMGLGMSSEVSESTQKQTNRRPVSWGAAMAGPLGEVLTTSSAKVGSCKSSSGFNLLTEGWDGSPQLGSSPTGVLQKASFGSLSNSSSGSSPRTEGKKIHEVAGFYDEMFVSTIASSSPVPSL